MSLWKKIAGIGSMVAPFALAPFTGGMSLPLSLALKGGTAAGLGALAAGKKGAALGGIGGLGSGLATSGKLGGLQKLFNLGSTPGAESSSGGILSKIFGKNGLDPTLLALGGLSAIGGGEDTTGTKLRSFKSPGSNIDPVQSREESREALLRLGQGLSEKPGTRLRSSYVQPGPSPVQIKGIPFQIGGGLGIDPALMDPTLLQSRSVQEMGIKDDPFQSLAKTRRKEPK